MDPRNPDSFNHRVEKLYTGRTYHFVDQIPGNYDNKRTTTLLCIHGFPDFWYGWRHQIGPWVREGYRVVVPDMLGYGGTSKPVEAAEYSTKKLCADLVALLDILLIKRAVVIGHDWGSYTAGRFALWHPDRILALVMLSVPYTPPSPVYLPIEEVAKKAPNLGYQVYFASPKSTLEVQAHLKKFLPFVYSPNNTGPNNDFTSFGSLEKYLLHRPTVKRNPVLNDKELQLYEAELSKGMWGPLNYYRTSKFRHDEEMAAALPSNLRADLPVLFMWGTKDATATSFVINKSRKFIKRYQDFAVEGKGHWLMVEAKSEVTLQVIRWLEALRTAKASNNAKL
ncbi:epoxide hydrolase [Panaeolus papilionaceus]|nr:epoxide hydrolase [Panaeolus papilionaceus]